MNRTVILAVGWHCVKHQELVNQVVVRCCLLTLRWYVFMGRVFRFCAGGGRGGGGGLLPLTPGSLMRSMVLDLCTARITRFSLSGLFSIWHTVSAKANVNVLIETSQHENDRTGWNSVTPGNYSTIRMVEIYNPVTKHRLGVMCGRVSVIWWRDLQP